MPVRRRKPSLQSPSPYNVPNQRVKNDGFGTRLNSRGYRRQQRHRHSSWTIHEDSVKQFIPTSISEYGCRSLGGSNGGSCMSLCGMFDADSDENSPGYQTAPKDQKPQKNVVNGNGTLSGLRSRCYSMPVDVPLRKTAGKAKKNKKARSSGGYFFDKYMKRFRSKRSPSLGSDGLKSPGEKIPNVTSDIEMKEVYDLSNSPMKNFRSNRQDMVVMESGVSNGNLEYHQLDAKYQYEDDDAVFADDASDDLYPIRYGTSTKWSAYCLNPTVPAIKTEEYECASQLMTTSYSNNNITVHVTATPLSPPPPCSVFPPLFWGDATHGPRDSYMPTSPVPSLSDYCYESSCCYSDSNSVTLKAMETLYLCNFRVSVDGEWLCLRELEQGCDVSKAVMAYNCPDDTPLKDMNGDSTTPSPGSSTTNSSTIEQLRVERRNLLGMAKLSIKGLIESSLSAGHTLDSDHAPLQQFFIIMESVLRHGLRNPKHIFAGNKQFWGPLEAIEKIAGEAAEITNSVRELPGIKTHIGRARAWLRLALMQKRLADYFRLMVEHRDFMKEFYDTESLVMSEEGIVLSGHLVGLNCIDANLCMKGDDLDNQNAVIDYSLYIRDGNRLSVSSESELTNGSQEEMKSEQESETMEEKMQKLANQKNYLEERNRYLETTLTELQKRSGETSTSNLSLVAELDAAKISVSTLREERQRLLDEKENMTTTHRKILHDRQADLDMERETLVQSRAGLDDMLGQVKKHLKHETQMRMEVERELELQISLKQELEVAMKLLEKDIYSKQDSLVILREQLDNVKAINIDIYKKLQDKADSVESKGKAITDLEEETKRLNDEVGKLKEKFSMDLLQVEKRRLDLALI